MSTGSCPHISHAIGGGEEIMAKNELLPITKREPDDSTVDMKRAKMDLSD